MDLSNHSSLPCAIHCNQNSRENLRINKSKKSAAEHIKNFWVAPSEALFSQETIAAVFCLSTKTLECDRWRGAGIPFRKVGGRVLYQKHDVIQYLESHELVTSTSEYPKGVHHG